MHAFCGSNQGLNLPVLQEEAMLQPSDPSKVIIGQMLCPTGACLPCIVVHTWRAAINQGFRSHFSCLCHSSTIPIYALPRAVNLTIHFQSKLAGGLEGSKVLFFLVVSPHICLGTETKCFRL